MKEQSMKNALYYPHIAFRDPRWIKAMALYYDNVYRIVPRDISPNDPEELKALLEEGSIGKKINPAEYSKNASEEFLNKAHEWRAAALTYEDFAFEDEELITRLHTEKTDKRVRELFREAGFQSDNDWMYVPTAIASNFMLYMASEIASKNDLSLITSDWGAWTGSSYFGIDGRVNDFITTIGKDEIATEGFGLFGLLINELTPINISEIPSEKIVEFRQKRKDEINQFRHCIQDLRKELIAVESSEIRVDIIQSKAKGSRGSAKPIQG